MHVLSKFLSGNECVKEYISFGRLDSSVNMARSVGPFVTH